MTEFTFEARDILNSQLLCGNSTAYTTNTSLGILGKTPTTLTGPGLGTAGKINWGRPSFEIGGQKYNCWKMWRPRVWLSMHHARNWTWGGQTYAVRLSEEWTMTTPQGEVARFRPHKFHLLGESEHAVLQISPAVEDEQLRVFIILVMLWSETKRKESDAATG
ncbi:hypothetical protein C8R44DRAFT_818380 [Mycena epipterygia]|nr:hypothetical protein C8R44DRAFT_818380 [Mycena epipterygia]